VLYASDLYIDEAMLTGEPLPAKKDSTPLLSETTLGDRHNELFAGTLVTQGVATAIVIATDAETELGKIATVVGKTREEETPLQKAVKRLSLIMSVVLIGITLIVFIIGLAQGQSWNSMFLTAVALAVSAIPEGLPVALTVILAVGVERMAKRKGVAETASATAVKNIELHDCPCARPMIKTISVIPINTTLIIRLNRFTAFCSGVSSSRVLPTTVAILPSSVSASVAITIAVATP
jgi:magnesium-transporting ATPase (P-type)